MTITREKVVVVGAGVAGCTAALEAARRGLAVTLVDEHPQNTAAMSLDAPYFYGARLAPVLSDEGTIADRVLGSNDLLMECLEAGVEVLTNTCIWGLFVSGANNEHLECNQVGLADAEKSWMLGFEYLVIAAGARDLVLSFEGWHLPGVLAAKGATTLLGKYQALGGNQVLIVGSGNVALQLAIQALEAGIKVVGVVEAADELQGDSSLVAELNDRGVPSYTGYCVQKALGTNEVSGAVLAPVNDKSRAPIEIHCDTICMAYGVVPNVELVASAGGALDYDAARGGWAPRLSSDFESTLKNVFVAGDAAGVSELALINPEISINQAQRIAVAIAQREGEASEDPDELPALSSDSRSVYPPQYWLDALVTTGGMGVMACQCEEVSRQEVVEVKAPKYLESSTSSPCEAVKTFVAEGQASQDMLKRMTRVGMGHCQGRRCREHSAMLLAGVTGIELSKVSPGSYRVPVRALPLNIIRAHDETAEMRNHWPTWLHPVDDTISGAH
ncbi:FAD-dependent oxidoreductase [Pseudomonas sp. PhalM4]